MEFSSEIVEKILLNMPWEKRKRKEGERKEGKISLDRKKDEEEEEEKKEKRKEKRYSRLL